jgi:hypothetical protein
VHFQLTESAEGRFYVAALWTHPEESNKSFPKMLCPLAVFVPSENKEGTYFYTKFIRFPLLWRLILKFPALEEEMVDDSSKPIVCIRGNITALAPRYWVVSNALGKRRMYKKEV